MDNYTVNDKRGILCSSFLLRLFTVLVLSLFTPKLFAQLDLIHYVPPLYAGTSFENDIENHWVVLTTPSETPIVVTIKRGDGTTFKTVPNVSISTPQKVSLNDGYGSTLNNPPLGVVNYTSLNKVITDQGLIFTSTEAFYVNVRHKSEIHGLSLTAKGQAGLGTSFRSGHLHSVRGVDGVDWGWGAYGSYRIVNHRSHFISVMATEDNTQVTFSDIKVGNLTSDTRTAMPVTGDIVVTLNEGESYVLGANHEFLTPAEVNKFNGTKISSDKPIAVNSGSWCGSASTSNQQDIGVDQIVPEKLVGNEYILLKGQGNSGSERPVVVATKDNTNIRVNGSPVIIHTILHAGESYPIETSYFSAEGTMLINTDEPVYMYQTTAASLAKPYPTIGMNFIPPLSSLGFRQVDIPFINELGTGIVAIYSQNGATVSVNGTQLDQATAKLVPNKEEWVVYTYSTAEENVSVISDKAIYVAMSVFDNVVGAAGYFSGFTKSISPIDPTVVFSYDLGYICSNREGNIELEINSTPIPDWYEWYHDIIHPDSIKFKNENLLIPVPDEATKYILKAYFRDPNMDILYNGDFAIGRGSFNSDLDFFNVLNLDDPGKATLCSNPESVNTRFESFIDLDGVGKMLLAHSSGNGNSDTIWQKTITNSVDIPNRLFVLKVYGRLAEEGNNQYLDIYVNKDKVYSNFQLNDTKAWKSIKAFWRAGTSETAKISIVDANATGKDAVFAIDSISFVPAIEATKEFNPDVVPSYSYTPYDKGLHFCKGEVQGVADISYGDMGWFTFLWEKELPDGSYAPITDPSITGLDTYKLIFNNVVDNHAGIYRCTIGFRNDYEQCGIDAEPTSVNVEVIVDEPARIISLTGEADICQGESLPLVVNVEGKFSRIVWSVNGVEKSEGQFFDFNSDKSNGAGIYTIRCDVENACVPLSQELQIEIFGNPNLTGLQVPTNLCHSDDVTLTALGSFPADARMEFSWFTDKSILPFSTSSINTQIITPDITDSYYKVSVSAQYDVSPGLTHTCSGNEKVVNLSATDIYPQVVLTDLAPVTLCEGEAHLYSADLETSGNYYTYLWETPAAVGGNKSNPDLSLTDITTAMAGTYKVTVSNRCGTANSTSVLSVTPKMNVTDISIDKLGPYCAGDNVTFTIDATDADYYKAENTTTGQEQTINPILSPFVLTANAANEGVWEITAVGNCGTSYQERFTIDLLENFSDPSLSSVTTCYGEDVSFEVQIETIPSGSDLTYTWTVPIGSPVVDSGTATLDITDVQVDKLGLYTCRVENKCGYFKDVTATLNAESVTSPLNETEAICQGVSNYLLKVDYVGTPTFAWRFVNTSGVETILGTNPTYTIPTVELANAGIYYCDITLDCGVVKYQRELVVNDHISVTNDPSVVLDICEFEQTELIINVTGTPTSIKWFDVNNDEMLAYANRTRIPTGILGPAKTFHYRYELTGNCEDLSGDFYVTAHAAPRINPIADINKCEGNIPLSMAITTSTGHPATNYKNPHWLNPDGSLLGNGLTATISGAVYPVSSGNYIAKVSSDYCGDATAIAKVNVYEPVGIVSNSDLSPTPCVNESLSLTVNGKGDGLSYKWTKGGVDLGAQPIPNILDLGTADLLDNGTYKCELISANGCTGDAVDFTVDVREHAKVTLQPLAQTPCDDASATFIVAGTAELTPKYQWYRNNVLISDGGNYAGARTTNLVVSNVLGYDTDLFHCKVSGDFCDPVESDKVRLNVKRDISITSQPVSLTIDENGSATFSVTATGGIPINYQWYENGVSMGATPASAQTASLTLTNVPYSYNGNTYYCKVSNTCDTKDSNPARLNVTLDNRITAQGVNAEVCEGSSFTFTVDYKATATGCVWEYDNGSGFSDASGLGGVVSGGTSSTLTVTAATRAMETDSWKFRARVQRTGYVDNLSNELSVKVYEQVVFDNMADVTLCTDAGESFAVSNLTGTGPFDYEWKRGTTSLGTTSSLNLNAAAAVDGTYSIEVTNHICTPVVKTFDISHYADLVITGITSIDPVCENVAEDLVVSITKDPALTDSYSWTKDGNPLVGTTNTYTIDGTSTAQTGLYEVVVDDGCTTKSISSFVNVLKDISLSTGSPGTTNLCEGENLSLHVTGSGDNLSYNWYKTTAPATSLSTTETLDKLNMLAADAGVYRCDLTSASGCNTDFIEFTVNVGKHATITNPVDFSLCEGTGNASFNVVATGEGVLTYKWYDNNVIMGGETAANLSVNSLLTNNGHSYHCVVNGTSCDEAISEKAVLTVKENVAITKQPVDVSVADGGTVAFTVEASGTGPFTYQWFEDGVSMGNTPPAAQTNTLTMTALLANNGKEYFCRVTGDCTSDDSDPATLTVDVNKRITAQSGNSEACVGDDFTFTVDYKISTDVCEWEYSTGGAFVLIPGGVGSSLETNVNVTTNRSTLTVNTASTAMNSWKFRARVKEGVLADDLSDEFVVVVFEPTDFIAITDKVLCKNEGASFSVNGVTGTGPYTYEWKRDAAPIGTNSSLSLDGSGATDDIYSIGVSNGVCPVTTKTFNISHYADLNITGISSINPVCENVAKDLVVSITKDPALTDSYSWTKDGNPLVGTTDTYTIDGSNISQTGLYEVVVDDGCMTKSITSFVNVLEDISLSTSSPLTSNLCEGEDLGLYVTGSGVGLSYNWYKTTAPTTSLSTSETLDIANMQEANGGTYRCVLTSASACNEDQIDFIVNVRKHATVNNPTDVSICQDTGNATFNVTGTANGTVIYKWYENDALIPTATTDNLSVSSSITKDGNSYHCVVNGDFCDEAISEKAVLTIDRNVIITNQPVNVTIDERGDVVFTVAATGTGLSYQWYENGVSMGSTPASAQSAVLSLTNVPYSNDGHTYYCKVTGTCSSEDSDPAAITIVKENRILAQAENTEVCQGNSFKFKVDYKTTTDDCEWEYDSGLGYNPIGGLGTIDNSDPDYSELTITTATNAMNSWKFRAVVKRTNYENNVSNDVSVRVDTPASFDPIANVQICNGDGASFIVDNLSGSTPNTYQWTEGARSWTGSSLNLIAADATDGTYSIGVTAGVCPATVKTFDISHYPDLTLSDLIHATELCPTDDINLNITISTGPAVFATYSWAKDNVDLGETTASYTKLNVADIESGLYKVTVEDHCMTQSKSIDIDVLDVITATDMWTDQALCVGDELLLEAKVSGDNPTYTWIVPVGVANPGNVASIKVDAVTGINDGTYECSVSGTCGTPIVYSVDIEVNDVPKITTGIAGIGALCENEALVLGPIVYEATNDENILWKFNGGLLTGESLTSLDLGNAELAEEGNYRVEVTNACGTDFSIGFQDVHPIPTLDPIANQIACQGENVIVRAVTSGEELTFRWFVDGVHQVAFDDKDELELANVQPATANTIRVYNVECRVSSCGTNLNELASITVNPNTILNKSLKGEVVYVGTDHEFDLDVTGSNLVFEWTHIKTDGTPVSLGETTKTLTLSNLSLANAGEYTCKITGNCGVRFTSGYLTVKDPLKVVEGLNTLANIEKCLGEPLNLNISVEGEVFSIDWYKGTTALGHHELNYSIPALDISDAGLYRCEIVGEGARSSQSVNVVVYQTTVLNSGLVDETLCENENLSWTPDVTGSELTYNWKYGGATVSTDATLSILTLPLTASGTYSVDIAGKCGSVSTEADLSINELPRFASKSNDLEKCENDAEAIFTVSYTGDNLVYQWQKDGIDIAGANSPKLKLLNLRTTDAGAYKCVVSSTCGVAPGDHVMKLIVIPQLKILSESPGMEICDGEDAQFLVDVEGTDEVYQWQKDGVAITGENAPQLTINPASLTEDGYYSCEVSDKCTAKRYSNSKRLKVNSLPNSEIFGRMTLCVLEDRVAYNTSIKPDINYGWLVDGGAFTTPAEDVVKTKITWGDVNLNGKVKLKILNESTGCYSEVDSLVKLHPLPDVTLSTLESRGICEPEFDLSGGLPEGGIYWVNGVAQNTFDPARGKGEYQVRYSYTDNLGCSNSTDETTMTIDSLPVVKLIEDIVVGSCGSTLLSATTKENNIKWAPSRFLDDPNSETPTFTAGETTLYVATVVDKHGCAGNDIVNVTVAPLPLITTINDTIIGECKEIELTTHISGNIEEINWSNADDLDNPTNSNPKLIKRKVGVNHYQINVTDKYGCIGSESVRVEVLPNPEVGENKFICEGESIVVDTKNLSNPIWSDGYTAWERVIDKPGEYELTVEQHDCELKQRIVMNPLPEFKLDNTIQPGIVIFEGQTVVLDPDLNPDYGPYVYDWSDGSVLSQLEVSETNTYKLKVVDNIGCVASNSVDVVVKPIGIESPNAFTPLSKNENDRFYLKDINITDKFEMYIYNRWGELLYKTNEAGYANGWDGTYKGEDCPVGAYVWVVMLDGKVKEKGNVILVR